MRPPKLDDAEGPVVTLQRPKRETFALGSRRDRREH